MNDEHEVIALERAALQRWCNGDPSGFLELSAPDVVYFDPFLHERLDGLAALTKYYESMRKKVSVQRFELENPYVHAIDNAAVLTFNFLSFTGSSSALRWNCTEVYRKDPVGWRLVQTHWSFTARG